MDNKVCECGNMAWELLDKCRMAENCQVMSQWRKKAQLEPPCKTGSQCVGGKCERCAQPEPQTGDCLLTGVCAAEGHRIQKAQPEPEPEPDEFVYKATTKAGETAHFGVYSAAKAWAKSGTVEKVPIRSFKVVQKPCDSCESLARAVMLDQFYHENVTAQREWQGLTDEEIDGIYASVGDVGYTYERAIEAKLKEKNT